MNASRHPTSRWFWLLKHENICVKLWKVNICGCKEIYKPVAKSQQKNCEIWKSIIWIERVCRWVMAQISEWYHGSATTRKNKFLDFWEDEKLSKENFVGESASAQCHAIADSWREIRHILLPSLNIFCMALLFINNQLNNLSNSLTFWQKNKLFYLHSRLNFFWSTLRFRIGSWITFNKFNIIAQININTRNTNHFNDSVRPFLLHSHNFLVASQLPVSKMWLNSWYLI